MAKVSINLEDTEDGTVSVKVDFDPPVENEHAATMAQNAAALMLEALSRAMGHA